MSHSERLFSVWIRPMSSLQGRWRPSLLESWQRSYGTGKPRDCARLCSEALGDFKGGKIGEGFCGRISDVHPISNNNTQPHTFSIIRLSRKNFNTIWEIISKLASCESERFFLLRCDDIGQLITDDCRTNRESYTHELQDFCTSVQGSVKISQDFR